MRVTLAFIKWIFKKLFESILEKNQEYRYFLERETGLALFLWLIVSGISSLVILMILAFVQHETHIDIPVLVWFGYIALCVFYLFYTGFIILYGNFKEERAQIFETIKNGR